MTQSKNGKKQSGDSQETKESRPKNGRFAPGNPGGPGRGHKAGEEELRKWIKNKLGKDTPKGIIDTLVTALASKSSDGIKAIEFIMKWDKSGEEGLKSDSPEMLAIIGEHIKKITGPSGAPMLVDKFLINEGSNSPDEDEQQD